MRKEEYLLRVQGELGFMTSERYNEACAYFESCFDGSRSDDEVMRELGSPKTAAQNYYSGYARHMAAPKGIKMAKLPKGVVAALVILLLPVLIPAVLAAVLLAFTVAGAAVMLIAAIPVITVGMWIGGAGMFVGAFTHSMVFIDRLMQIGSGLAFSGFGLLFTWLAARWYRYMMPALLRGIVNLGNKILNKISPVTGGEE